MEIKKELNGTALTLSLSGRLDAVTAPDLDKVVQNDLTGITDLTLDFSELVYVASAGLRVLLLAQKRMKKQGKDLSLLQMVIDDLLAEKILPEKK